MNTENYQFFKENIKELIEKYPKKYVLIHDKALVKVFDDYIDAVNYALSKFKLGTFLVQQCIPLEESKVSFINFDINLTDGE